MNLRKISFIFFLLKLIYVSKAYLSHAARNCSNDPSDPSYRYPFWLRSVPLESTSSQITYDQEQQFYIRKGLFADLGKVADIMVDSFYSPSVFVRPFLYASELQRLQRNFPYDDRLHSYFVACKVDTSSPDRKEIVLGFVDVDARQSGDENAPPRPYLSDLAVDKEWRRLGIAKSLIQKCEVKVKEMGSNRLFLRVEGKNIAALNMYSRLGYSSLDHHYFGIKDTTILLERRMDGEM